MAGGQGLRVRAVHGAKSARAIEGRDCAVRFPHEAVYGVVVRINDIPYDRSCRVDAGHKSVRTRVEIGNRAIGGGGSHALR
jgi:hypothetical protein